MALRRSVIQMLIRELLLYVASAGDCDWIICPGTETRSIVILDMVRHRQECMNDGSSAAGR